MSQGKLRQRGSIAWLVLTFSQPTLVLFTVCNEASFCTPITPHSVHIPSLGCSGRNRRNATFQNWRQAPRAAGRSNYRPIAGWAEIVIVQHALKLRPHLTGSPFSVSFRFLRTHYFDLTASLVTRRRPLVFHIRGGIEDRRETDGRVQALR